MCACSVSRVALHASYGNGDQGVLFMQTLDAVEDDDRNVVACVLDDSRELWTESCDAVNELASLQRVCPPAPSRASP